MRGPWSVPRRVRRAKVSQVGGVEGGAWSERYLLARPGSSPIFWPRQAPALRSGRTPGSHDPPTSSPAAARSAKGGSTTATCLTPSSWAWNAYVSSSLALTRKGLTSSPCAGRTIRARCSCGDIPPSSSGSSSTVRAGPTPGRKLPWRALCTWPKEVLRAPSFRSTLTTKQLGTPSPDSRGPRGTPGPSAVRSLRCRRGIGSDAKPPSRRSWRSSSPGHPPRPRPTADPCTFEGPSDYRAPG